MALILCPECGTEVSDQAIACPKCARPLREASPEAPTVTKRAGAPWEMWGFGLIAAGVVLGITGLGGFAAALIAVGFVVFIVGRFN